MQSFSPYRAFDHVYNISRFHRIQGSQGLIDAANYIYDNLKVKEKQMILYDYDGQTKYGNFTVPMGWDPVQGELSVGGKKLIGFDEVPLFIAGHSPSGDVEGIVTEDVQKADGRILMTSSRDARKQYLVAVKRGALGVIFYSDTLPETAVPYRGLFLTKAELSYTIPAVSIPRNLVNKVRDQKVRIKVETKTGPKKMPVIYATTGSRFLVSAHMCHPFPGANDNASGAGLSLELANAGAKADFLWIPEHYGSLAFFSDHDVSYDFGLNLDMVGENQAITGSILQISYTPYSQKSFYEELIKMIVRDLDYPSIRYNFVDYDIGSDHAVLVQNGIPAMDFTNWPDRFYHSSEDFADKVSTETLSFVGEIVMEFLSRDVPIYLEEAWKAKYKAYLLEKFGREDAEKLSTLRRAKYRNFLPNASRYMTPDNAEGFPDIRGKGVAYVEYANLSAQLGEEDALRIAAKAYGSTPEDIASLKTYFG
ncbi:MAG: DUF4910 domain-containing protein [Thermoprotei archaeon]